MSEIKLKLEKYKAGSVIYIENSREVDDFFIIKEGKVKLSREIKIPGLTELTVSKGDYFGVVSCISKRPRLETATALTDVLLISINNNQFIPVMQKNQSIAIKILKLYSTRLREFDEQIIALSARRPVRSSPVEIYKAGIYYLKQKAYKKARYTLKRVIEFVRQGEIVNRANKYLEKINQIIGDQPDYDQISDIERLYFDKSLLFCEHEPGREVFIIQDGKVKITKIVDEKEVLLAVLNEGDIIGEMALIENKPRSATAEAFGDVRVIVVDKKNFLTLISTHPQIVHKILTLLSERIWIAYKQLENFMITDPVGRMIDILAIQLEKERVEIIPKRPYKFEFGLEELANMAGLSVEKDMPVIRKILDEPNIRLDGDHIYIEDVSELVKLAEIYKKKAIREKQRETSIS